MLGHEHLRLFEEDKFLISLPDCKAVQWRIALLGEVQNHDLYKMRNTQVRLCNKKFCSNAGYSNCSSNTSVMLNPSA